MGIAELNLRLAKLLLIFGGWQVLGMFQRTVTAKDMIVAVVVIQSGSSWLVIALETPAVAGPLSTEDAARRVFGQHAHEVVGSFEEIVAALAAADAYLERWCGNRGVEWCKCGEIGQKTVLETREDKAHGA